MSKGAKVNGRGQRSNAASFLQGLAQSQCRVGSLLGLFRCS